MFKEASFKFGNKNVIYQTKALSLNEYGNTIEYTFAHNGDFDHSISLNEQHGETTMYHTISWDNQYETLQTTTHGQWNDNTGIAEYNNESLYTHSALGDQLTIVESLSEDGVDWIDSSQLQMNPLDHAEIDLLSISSWDDGQSSGSVMVSAVASDSEADVAAHAQIVENGVENTFHIRDNFAQLGAVRSELMYCEELEGIDCTDPANWVPEHESTNLQTMDLLEQDVSDAGIEELLTELLENCKAWQDDPATCETADIIVLDELVDSENREFEVIEITDTPEAEDIDSTNDANTDDEQTDSENL